MSGFGSISSEACTHPPNMRSTLHGFGQRAEDVKEFFCRGCQRHIQIEDEGAKNRDAIQNLDAGN